MCISVRLGLPPQTTDDDGGAVVCESVHITSGRLQMVNSPLVRRGTGNVPAQDCSGLSGLQRDFERIECNGKATPQRLYDCFLAGPRIEEPFDLLVRRQSGQ